MSDIILQAISAIFCGALTTMGVGGGSLLIIITTQFFQIGQQQAQLINLIYFLPAGALGVKIHNKSGYVDKKTGRICALFGIVAAIGASILAIYMSPVLLRKAFGILLFIMGIWELFKK